MKLHQSPTSPFVRKVLVAAHERGLANRIELLPTSTMASGELATDNPLAKVPALVTDDGEAIYDSLVIVTLLDTMGSGPRMMPVDAATRVAVLRRHALADGMMQAAVASVMETRRPDDKIWSDFIHKEHGRVSRGLAVIEGEIDVIGGHVDLATISIGVALGYIDFRLGDFGWRETCPKLAAWYAEFSQRPSMVGTAPPA
ncbi:MAG: glutathione S-transferase N-terminal domain-containing protein [Rhodospirillales bacterium]|nr:glutathione S-transferase N-terminal domain-containing protein [Rhodospirillales bacterium]